MLNQNHYQMKKQKGQLTVSKVWQVEYSAAYWVEADSEEEAIEKGIEAHENLPDGDWKAFIDPYNSDNFNSLGEK